MWTAPLMAQNTALPANVQSWSFRLTSGADFTAADFHRVQSLEDLADGTGSILLGKERRTQYREWGSGCDNGPRGPRPFPGDSHRHRRYRYFKRT